MRVQAQLRRASPQPVCIEAQLRRASPEPVSMLHKCVDVARSAVMEHAVGAPCAMYVYYSRILNPVYGFMVRRITYDVQPLCLGVQFFL